MATLIRVDRNGTKYFEGLVNCDRCGGIGLYATGTENGHLRITPVDNGVCWRCGGTGKEMSKWKEYTPEYEAKLEARRKARREKYEQEHAEEIAKAKAEQEAREAERKAKEEAERLAREAEEKAEAERKAKSQYVGEIGDKIEIEVMVERVAWYEVKSFRGYGMETIHVYTFRDADGNAIVWKTSKGMNLLYDVKFIVKGTIKDHNEYNGEKQTVLTRCKIETGATE